MPNNGSNNETMADNGSNNSDNGTNNADNATAKKRGRPFGAKDGVKRKPYVRRPAPVVAEVRTTPETMQTRPETMQTRPEATQTRPETIQTIPKTRQTMPERRQTIPETSETIVSPSLPEPSTRDLIYQYHVNKREREEAQWTELIKGMMVRPVR